MEKLLLSLLVSITLVSCAGYLGRSAGAEVEGGVLNPLALVSGGTLSDEAFHEVSPFLYRDTNGTAWLFYSSDRDGSYDIYCAEMTPEGLFKTPVKLGDGINNPTNQEKYPVVLNLTNENLGIPVPYLFLISRSVFVNGQQILTTNYSVYSYPLDFQNMGAGISPTLAFPQTAYSSEPSLGLKNKALEAPSITLSSTGLNWEEWAYLGGSWSYNNSVYLPGVAYSIMSKAMLPGPGWSVRRVMSVGDSNGNERAALAEFVDNVTGKSGLGLNLYWAYQSDTGPLFNRSQIYFTNELYFPAQYTAAGDGRDPDYDSLTGAVYFTSSRSGSGSDLYRFNISTMPAVLHPAYQNRVASDRLPAFISFNAPAPDEAVTYSMTVLVEAYDNEGTNTVPVVTVLNPASNTILASTGQDYYYYYDYQPMPGDYALAAETTDENGNVSKVTNTIVYVAPLP